MKRKPANYSDDIAMLRETAALARRSRTKAGESISVILEAIAAAVEDQNRAVLEEIWAAVPESLRKRILKNQDDLTDHLRGRLKTARSVQ